MHQRSFVWSLSLELVDPWNSEGSLVTIPCRMDLGFEAGKRIFRHDQPGTVVFSGSDGKDSPSDINTLGRFMIEAFFDLQLDVPPTCPPAILS